MALTAKSLFLYGYTLTEVNNKIDFKTSSTGAMLTATVPIGDYSLNSLLPAVGAAMQSVASSDIFSCSADRTFSSGTENRVVIPTNGSFLSLYFSSGPSSGASIAPVLGFPATDLTGATAYAGSTTTGIAVESTLVGYNYLGPEYKKRVFGSVNISTAGYQEGITYPVQNFIQVEFKYEPQTKVDNEWAELFDWLIQQKPFDFTPEITAPTVFYECFLSRTSADGKGMAHDFKEMLPSFPFLFDTGQLTFRKRVDQ